MSEIVEYVIEHDSFFKSESVSLSEQTRLKAWVAQKLPYVTVKKIVKIRNEHLYAAFRVKKQMLGHCQVIEVLHSTSASNLDSIQKRNLDWRMVSRTKYGFGTSFSANADYANFYSSFSGGTDRVFLVCDILAKNIKSVNDNSDTFPKDSADTYRSMNGHVYVKFDDFTYYPKYALYYDRPDHKSSGFWKPRRKYYLR